MRGLRRSFVSWRGVGRASVKTAPRQRHHIGLTRLRREVGLLRRAASTLTCVRLSPRSGGSGVRLRQRGEAKAAVLGIFVRQGRRDSEGIPREGWGRATGMTFPHSPRARSASCDTISARPRQTELLWSGCACVAHLAEHLHQRRPHKTIAAQAHHFSLRCSPRYGTHPTWY